MKLGRWLVGVVMAMSMMGSLFAFDKVLYIAYPKPGPTTNVYPQEASTGFFINQMLHTGLTALPDWLIVSEMPTNTNNMILFRLETTYTLTGPVARPNCIYAYRLYNENNRLLFQTNITSDITRGMLDAVDVAIFGTGRAVGQDLSQFAIVSFTVPTFEEENYHLYLNRNKIADLTNREPLALRYRLMANEAYTISLREAPALANLWMGSMIWQTNVTFLRGQTTNVAIEPMSAVTIRPLRTEVFFPAQGSYLLSVSSRQPNATNTITNIVLPLGRSTNIFLPLGRSYGFDILYPSRNLVVSSDSVNVQRTTHAFQPIDRIQTRPLYLSFETAVYAPSVGSVTFLPYAQAGVILYYYPFMNQRFGAGFAMGTFPLGGGGFVASGTISTISASWGIYPFSKRYHALRWNVEGSVGWQIPSLMIARTNAIDVPLEAYTARVTTNMTGFIAEVSTGLEYHFLSGGISAWIAPRTGWNLTTLSYEPVLLYGLSVFMSVII